MSLNIMKWTLLSYKSISSRPGVFCKKSVCKNFVKLTRKHLTSESFFGEVSGNLFKKVANYFKNTFFHRTPVVASANCSPVKCQCCPHIETSQLICCANQLTGFYIRRTVAFNVAILMNNNIHFVLIFQFISMLSSILQRFSYPLIRTPTSA